MNSLAPRYRYFSDFSYKAFQKAALASPPSPEYQNAHFTVSLASLDLIIFKILPLLKYEKLCCFNVHFLNVSEVWQFSICLLAFSLFLCGLVIHILCPFYSCTLLFFLLNCKRSYIENTEDNVNISLFLSSGFRW